MDNCKLCGAPVEGGRPHPEADVYHAACLMEATKHLREESDGRD